MSGFNKIINIFKSVKNYYRTKIAIIESMQKALLEIQRDLKRLELLNLIQHTPTNIDTIFLVAEKYFKPESEGGLGGNWFMDSEFIKWANKYNNGILPDWFKYK